MAGNLDRQPVWVREWIEHLRQRAIKKRHWWYRERVTAKRPTPEQVLSLPFWVQDLIADLEYDLE